MALCSQGLQAACEQIGLTTNKTPWFEHGVFSWVQAVEASITGNAWVDLHRPSLNAAT